MRTDSTGPALTPGTPLLDELEPIEGPFALVTTGAGKFYSNGLDLDWVLGEGATDAAFLSDVERLLLRILDLPAITVAAVNGHAFAAGAMLATAHDVVIMREDRGILVSSRGRSADSR